jgi:hypothetical protein
LATRVDAPSAESEKTHKIADGCYWDRHPDKWLRLAASDPADPLPRLLTIYVCNNCKADISAGLKDFTGRLVLPNCSSDWPSTPVRAGRSVYRTCEVGTSRGALTDYVPYATMGGGTSVVSLDPEIVLDRDGTAAWKLFDLEELGLVRGSRVVFMGRVKEEYVEATRLQGAVVGLVSAEAPDAFILVAAGREDVEFARASLAEYFRMAGRTPRIWFIDQRGRERSRGPLLEGLFAPVTQGPERALSTGYAATELRPVPE